VTAIKINYPEFESAKIPKGAYQGNVAIPPEDLPTVSIQPMLVAHPHVDSEVIRELTRILYEHRQELASKMPLATQITSPNQGSGSILPLHPGALAYYERDKPSFIEQNSGSLGFIFTVLLAIGSGVWQLKDRLEQTRENRSDRYNQKLVAIIKDIQQCPDSFKLEELRGMLYTEFEIIVNALDEEQITPEAFQSLKFA
jgi:hypothetical protein